MYHMAIQCHASPEVELARVAGMLAVSGSGQHTMRMENWKMHAHYNSQVIMEQ
jgi:hypothetical protein